LGLWGEKWSDNGSWKSEREHQGRHMISSSISKEDAQIQNSRKKKTNNNLTVSGMANHYKTVSAESCLM